MKIESRSGWGLTSKCVVADPAISAQAKGLYSLLTTYAGRERECWPSVERLAEEMGATTRTVTRWLDELEATGTVARRRRTGTSSMTVLNDFIVVVDSDANVSCEQDTGVA